MGIEGERLVYDYLSQVGDAAQREMSPGERVELVARVREDLNARIGDGGSPTTVRRALARMGTPEDVVAKARDAGGGTGRRDAERSARRRAEAAAAPPPPPREPEDRRAPAAPVAEDGTPVIVDPAVGDGREFGDDHLVGEGGRVRFDKRSAGAPLLMVRDEDLDDDEDDEEEDEGGAGGQARDAKPAAASAVREREPRSGPPPLVGAVGSLIVQLVRHPRELLGIALLLAGPVSGFWPLLLAGWALLYFAPRLRPVERMTASVLIPGLVLAGGAVWLWARRTGRMGAPPLGKHDVVKALEHMLPVLGWTGAIVTSLFLCWRLMRRRAARGEE
ncbi:hypothetical protein BIV57_12875 [Mangrovactinospora gilvigrisea]|uniref:Uncharacterized protein n=1 Tax=Mangrovactinospora gilvigrisea TaxID=1428644 RepID=A0A1J7BEJ2_9ACTN|nr:hypothetical protein [Mangrovactinospora gilvigrisea]OIV37054.1 hypothetical protein BIV57_12875 [Mangrovactinospora gilvigrisea]